MVMDLDHQNFKFVWYEKPASLETEAVLQYRVGDSIDISEGKQLSFSLDSYQHSTQKYGIDPLMVWVGSKEAVHQQLNAMQNSLELEEGQTSPFTFVVNVDKMLPNVVASSQQRKIGTVAPTKVFATSSSTSTATRSPKVQSPVVHQGGFSVEDIKLGESYE